MGEKGDLYKNTDFKSNTNQPQNNSEYSMELKGRGSTWLCLPFDGTSVSGNTIGLDFLCKLPWPFIK